MASLSPPPALFGPICNCVGPRVEVLWRDNRRSATAQLHPTLALVVGSPRFPNLQMRLGNSPVRARVTARFFDKKDNDAALRLGGVASSANAPPHHESLSLADQRSASVDPGVDTPCQFSFARVEERRAPS